MKDIFFLIATTMISVAIAGCSPNQEAQALGTLERDRILLKSTAAEIIIATPIPEGQVVKEGDVIIQLDDTNQKNQVAKADANLAFAKANLLKLHHGARVEDVAAARAQVSRAKSQWNEAQKTFERTATLVNKKLAGAANLDSARAIRDSAQADVEKSTQNLLLLTNGTRDEDIQQAEAQVAQAQAALHIEQHHLDELSVRATRTGILDRLPKYRGERVNVGETLAIILAGTAPYARVYIPEHSRVAVKTGDQLNVHVDGTKDIFSAQVRWVSQDPAFTPYYALNSSDRSRLVYLAEIQLGDAAKNLPSGVPVQVELPK